jgi:hypothetical protein
MAELGDAGRMGAASEFLIGNTIFDCVLAEISEMSSEFGDANPNKSEVADNLGPYVRAGRTEWASILRLILYVATVGILLIGVLLLRRKFLRGNISQVYVNIYLASIQTDQPPTAPEIATGADLQTRLQPTATGSPQSHSEPPSTQKSVASAQRQSTAAARLSSADQAAYKQAKRRLEDIRAELDKAESTWGDMLCAEDDVSKIEYINSVIDQISAVDVHIVDSWLFIHADFPLQMITDFADAIQKFLHTIGSDTDRNAAFEEANRLFKEYQRHPSWHISTHS